MSTTTSSPARTSGNAATTAPKRQRRFTLAVDHLDRGAQDLGGRVQEGGGVGGAPQRLRTDGGDAGVVAARDGREVAQHAQRAGDGFAIERAAAADAAAKPGDLGAFLESRRWPDRSAPPAATSCWCRCRWWRDSSRPLSQESGATRWATYRRPARTTWGSPRTRHDTIRSRSNTAGLRTRSSRGPVLPRFPFHKPDRWPSRQAKRIAPARKRGDPPTHGCDGAAPRRATSGAGPGPRTGTMRSPSRPGPRDASPGCRRRCRRGSRCRPAGAHRATRSGPGSIPCPAT